MGGSETAQQPDKLSHERGGIGRQHVSDGCVTDAVSQCHSVRACPSANGHSSSFGMLLPINEECRFDELLVRFRRRVGRSCKNFLYSYSFFTIYLLSHIHPTFRMSYLQTCNQSSLLYLSAGGLRIVCGQILVQRQDGEPCCRHRLHQFVLPLCQ